MAPSGVGVSEYTAMECGKVHGLGELLEERGEGDCRHFRGGSAAISANSGEALYRPGKSRIRVDSVTIGAAISPQHPMVMLHDNIFLIPLF